MKIKRCITLVLSILLVMLCAANAYAANFLDISATDWYSDSVNFVSEKGIMSGTGDNRFNPNGIITRGMIVTTIYRMDGAPAVSGSSSFKDVGRSAYYEKAVIWAAKNNIVNGYSATQFGPNDNVTREQFAAILYRYCSYKQGDVSVAGSLNQYKDADQISAYAKTAMLWANSNGLITGTSTNTLSPKETATRAQAAAIIMRYVKGNQSLSKKEDESVLPKQEESVPIVPERRESDDEPVQETTQPTLKVKTISAQAGDTVSVDVNLANNPGILGMTLTVSYDEQNMRLIKAESGSALADVLTFVAPKSLKSGSNFVWYETGLRADQIRDGSVLSLTFELSDSARGILPIVLTAVNGDIIDNNLETVQVLLQNGSIQIK